MKPLTKNLIIGGLAAGTLSLGAAQWAIASPGERGDCYGGRHAHRMSHDGDQRFERMADRLDLTDEQRKSVRAMLDQSRPQMRELDDKLRANRQALRDLADSDQVDEKQLRKIAKEQGELHSQMIVQRTQMHQQIRKVLTEEQREQLRSKRGKFPGKYQGQLDDDDDRGERS